MTDAQYRKLVRKQDALKARGSRLHDKHQRLVEEINDVKDAIAQHEEDYYEVVKKLAEDA